MPVAFEIPPITDSPTLNLPANESLKSSIPPSVLYLTSGLVSIATPLYSVAIVKWRISGPNESFLKEGIMYKSVKESNRISIKLHLDKIPNLELYLPNLLQFYKS